jgi:hypothetical protein
MHFLVTEESLRDRGRADSFTKSFAINQSTWLIVQSIARASSGLPLSELELATTAYVICAVVMYAFWWHKPFEVEYVTTIPVPYDWGGKWHRISEQQMMTDLLVGANRKSLWKPSTAFYSIATVFSAIHLAAWNRQFPTPVARTLWRSFGVIATVAGPISIVCVFILIQLDKKGNRNSTPFFLSAFFSSIVVVAYIVSRLGLIALIIYSFSSMPAGVYETVDWIKYFPYF